MGDNSPIEWTDATWNPIVGCSVLTPGCTNCYAMQLAGTRLKATPAYEGLTQETKAGPVWTGAVRIREEVLTQPMRWRRPRRVFVNSMGDLFHEAVPDAWIDQVFAGMALAPQHTFQVLTKRAERMCDYVNALAADWEHRLWATGMFEVLQAPDPHTPLPNVWLGVSTEDQPRANERVPLLLDTAAAVRWVSVEPMLGPVDLTFLEADGEVIDALRGLVHHHQSLQPRLLAPLDWVVGGGESGPGARPCDRAWARHLRDACAAAGTPFLWKQWGEFAPAMVGPGSYLLHDARKIERWGLKPGEETQYGPPGSWFDETEAKCASGAEIGRLTMLKVGKRRAGRLLDGQLHDAYPQVRP